MKFHILTLIVCLLTFKSHTTLGQVAADSVLADRYFAMGDSLLSNSKYDSSIFYFEKAADKYKALENWQRHFRSLNKICKNYLDLRAINKAEKIANQIVEESVQKLKSDNREEALAYTYLGWINFLYGENNKSAILYEKALIIQKKLFGEAHIDLIQTYSNMGALSSSQGDHDLALVFFNKARKNAVAIFGPRHKKVGVLLMNIGNVHRIKSDFSTAIQYYEKSTSIIKGLSNQDSRRLIYRYTNLAIAYDKIGNHNLALEYSNQALSIAKGLPNSQRFLSYIHVTLGNIYYNLKDYDKAIIHHLKNLELEISLYGELHPQITIAYHNLANAQMAKENLDLARDNHLKALDIRRNISGEQNQDVAASYISLGTYYAKKKAYTKALEYYQRSEKILRTIHGEKHFWLTNIYFSMGETYLELGDNKEAITSFDKAINAGYQADYDAGEMEHIDLDKFSNDPVLLEAIYGKAETLKKIYETTKLITDLENSLSNYQLASKLADKIRHAHLNYEDKVKTAEVSLLIYEGAIKTALQLFQITKDSSYKTRAFNFSEKSKSNVLTEAVSNSSAKSFGLIPDDVLDYEESLKVDLSFYKSQIQEEKSNKEGYDTTKMEGWEDKLFDLNRSSDSLTVALEEQYPRYYELKYQSNVFSVEETQRQIKPNEALVEYFTGDSTIYAYIITADQYDVLTIPKDTASEDMIRNFRKELQSSISSSDQKHTFKNLTTQSYDIYQKFVEPAIKNLKPSIDKLIIIPDGGLSYIPFDILLTEAPDTTKLDYVTLPYLLKKYKTQYGYSASLLFNDFEQEDKEVTGDLIAFAPSYDNVEIDSVRNLTLGKFRNNISSLKWNQPEVKSIAEHLQGVVYIGKEALEKTFKASANKYNIIHLAMHAFIDDDKPMNSKLIFTQDNDSIEDGYLHAYELYNMQLPAEMAVLSACETGFGKLAKGEGVMSLGRAFSYAGCPSVVMSHWPINDASTSKFMNHFYRHLSEGQSKDEALRNAKLDFLKFAEPTQANPFFWGSFVVMGDVSSLNIQKQWDWWYYFVGFMMILIIIPIVYSKRKIT